MSTTQYSYLSFSSSSLPNGVQSSAASLAPAFPSARLFPSSLSSVTPLPGASEEEAEIADIVTSEEKVEITEAEIDDNEIPIPECDWVKLEKSFCHRDNLYRPATKMPSLTQLNSAAKEFRRRFMCADGQDCGVPGVLVATGVDAELWLAKSEQTAYKCLLTDSGDLFMIGVPSPIHSKIMEETQNMIKAWLTNFGPLNGLMSLSMNRTNRTLRAEPDLDIHPELPWDAADSANPKPRVLIEVEYKHRGPAQSRRLWGRRLLTRSHFIRAYVLIRVYPRDAATRAFAAAAFVWRQGPVGAPAGRLELAPDGPDPLFPTIAAPVGPAQIAQRTLAATPIGNAAAPVPLVGAPVFHQVVEFGTKPLTANARAGFTRRMANGLPPAIPFPAFAGPAAIVNIQIPAADVFYLCRDGPGNVLWLPPAVGPVGNDLVIDLAHVRARLHRMRTFDDA